MAYKRDVITFSDFLNLNEINLFFQIKPELKTQYQLSGGYEFAERQMIAFIPDALSYEWEDTSSVEFPISCLKFTPAHPKFAEELNHRDVLGTLTSLGIERSKLGDIKIASNESYVLCHRELADYLLKSLDKIRHTSVCGQIVEIGNILFEQKFQEITGIVTSPRLDTVVSYLTGTSRSKGTQFIAGQKVFINSRLITSNAYVCKENDVISIRGYGKFIYLGCSGETKKGRMKITIKKYM